MPRFEIRIAGLGGQGVILAALVLGKAAALFGRRKACQTQSYGPESRGSACKAEVIIADEDIDHPKVERPDALVVMSQEAFQENIGDLKENGTLILDPDMVPGAKLEGMRAYAVPATRLAEELGNKLVANMVMVGATLAATDILDPTAAEKAIMISVPRGTGELNIAAFRRGYHFPKKHQATAK